MKKYIIAFLAFVAAQSSFAQETTQLKTQDQIMPRWCLDVNYKYGVSGLNFQGLSLQGYNTLNKPATGTSGTQGDLVSQTSYFSSKKQFSNGSSGGGDISIGYFFNEKRTFGIGLGLSYFNFGNTLSIDTFHVEYERVDTAGNTSRQIITSNNGQSKNSGKITENINATNISLPILFKYKHKFNKNVGVSVDAGPVLNFMYSNNYSTNAQFDYEMAYALAGQSNGNATLSFDPTPSKNLAATDWQITKAAYLAHDANATNMTAYFNNLRNQGYNVGLGVQPNSNSGTVKEGFGYGGLIQANLNYQLNFRFTFVIGGYYYTQFNSMSNSNKWKLTDGVGSYSSMLNGASSTQTTSYGLNIGVRYFIGGFSDVDGDGVADTKDDCPTQPGPEKYNGCPDADGDGIPDKFDACPNDPGPACTNGCPDRDHDCFDDKNDNCPDDYGLGFHGCPDRDGDGIPDYMDLCPDDSGTLENKGCPFEKLEKLATQILEKDNSRVIVQPSEQTSGTYLPPHIVLSTSVINFDFGKSKMSKESDDKLNEAIDVLNKNPKVILFIGGYTDNIGSIPTNLLLSYSRAQTVRQYLISKGVDKNRIIISGNGKDNPVDNNKTPQGRAKNRRIEMKVLLPLE